MFSTQLCIIHTEEKYSYSNLDIKLLLKNFDNVSLLFLGLLKQGGPRKYIQGKQPII